MDILVVDDEEAVRTSTVIALESDDHHAESASSGEQGLLRLKEEEFDLVLLDLYLGSENGLDILPQYLNCRPRTPVVIFTPETTVNTAVCAIQSGAMDYVKKPLTPDHLRSVIARARQWKQLQERIVELETQISSRPPPPPFKNNEGNPSAPMPGGSATIKELETEHIRRVLARTRTLQEAAGILGIDQATLYRKRKKCGL